MYNTGKHNVYFCKLNRIITNGSLPRDKRQTSPSPCNTPNLTRFASLIINGNTQLNPGILPNNKLGLGNSLANPSTTRPSSESPSSPFLPATESDLKSIFGFDSKSGKL